jgi:hypothetical protein
MNYAHILFAFTASAILASFTDWYFFGVLFHDRYQTTPGVWKKYKNKKDEMSSIMICQGYFTMTSLLFVIGCSWLGLTALPALLTAAMGIWIMVPVPLLLSNAVYIPMDRRIVFSHSLGWLARFLVTALCVAWLM